MPYTANVPLANQQISASQPIINANFQAILAAFNANHADLITGTGRHTFIQLAPQAPVPAFAGLPGFWASTAAGNPIMLHTAAGVDINISTNAFNAAVGGYSYLPSGLLIKFGTHWCIVAGPNNINLNAAGLGPAYAQVPFISLTGGQSTAPVVGFSTYASVDGATTTSAQVTVNLRYSTVPTNGAGALQAAAGPVDWITIGI